MPLFAGPARRFRHRAKPGPEPGAPSRTAHRQKPRPRQIPPGPKAGAHLPASRDGSAARPPGKTMPDRLHRTTPNEPRIPPRLPGNGLPQAVKPAPKQPIHEMPDVPTPMPKMLNESGDCVSPRGERRTASPFFRHIQWHDRSDNPPQPGGGGLGDRVMTLRPHPQAPQFAEGEDIIPTAENDRVLRPHSTTRPPDNTSRNRSSSRRHEPVRCRPGTTRGGAWCVARRPGTEAVAP